MGPFRLMDEIGLDICYHVAADLKDRLGIEGSGMIKLVDKIDKKQLGKKTGKGFYEYKKGRAVRNKSDQDATAAADLLVTAMIDEAKRILDEEVIDSSDMLDFAMIMGTGWAPFRGGPVRYSERLVDDTSTVEALPVGST